jgi:hypothetical protein
MEIGLILNFDISSQGRYCVSLQVEETISYIGQSRILRLPIKMIRSQRVKIKTSELLRQNRISVKKVLSHPGLRFFSDM